ncbi:MAG: hypothetical protein V4568_08505 [Pseudomonadota bacterium]
MLVPPHPNVVRCLGARGSELNEDNELEDGDVILERIKGKDGADVIKHLVQGLKFNAITYAEFFHGLNALIDGALKGLEHLAENGIEHADMKPENLMVAEDGRVIVIDLGFSREQHQKTSVHWPDEPFGSALSKIHHTDALGIAKFFSYVQEEILIEFPDMSKILPSVTDQYVKTFNLAGDRMRQKKAEAGSHWYSYSRLRERWKMRKAPKAIMKEAKSLTADVIVNDLNRFQRRLSSFSDFSWKDKNFKYAIKENFLFPVFSQIKDKPETADWQFLRDNDPTRGTEVLKRVIRLGRESEARQEIALPPPTDDQRASSIGEASSAHERSSAEERGSPEEAASMQERSSAEGRVSAEETATPEENAQTSSALEAFNVLVNNTDAQRWEKETAPSVLNALKSVPFPVGRSPFLRAAQVFKLDNLDAELPRIDHLKEIERLDALQLDVFADRVTSDILPLQEKITSVFSGHTPLSVLRHLDSVPASSAVNEARDQLLAIFPNSLDVFTRRREWQDLMERHAEQKTTSMLSIVNRLGDSAAKADHAVADLKDELSDIRAQIAERQQSRSVSSPFDHSPSLAGEQDDGLVDLINDQADLLKQVGKCVIHTVSEEAKDLLAQSEQQGPESTEQQKKSLQKELHDELAACEKLSQRASSKDMLENIESFLAGWRQRKMRYENTIGMLKPPTLDQIAKLPAKGEIIVLVRSCGNGTTVLERLNADRTKMTNPIVYALNDDETKQRTGFKPHRFFPGQIVPIKLRPLQQEAENSRPGSSAGKESKKTRGR